MSLPTPEPAQLPADEFVTQHYDSLPGFRTPTPTYELLSVDTDVAMSASLGAVAAVPLAGSPIMTRFEPLHLPESKES